MKDGFWDYMIFGAALAGAMLLLVCCIAMPLALLTSGHWVLAIITAFILWTIAVAWGAHTLQKH